MGYTVARTVKVEVEVPEGVRIGDEEIEAMRSGAKRALLYLMLEKAQKREPSREEVEELAREAKEEIYKKVVEARD